MEKFSQAAFAQLLISGTLVHESDFDELRQKLNITMFPHVVMLLSIDRYPDLAALHPFSWRMDIGKKLVSALHEAITVPFLWVWESEGVLAVLLELKSENTQNPTYKELIFSMVRDIQNVTDARGLSVSAGIGTYYENPYMLHRSYEEAKESMIDRFFQGNRMIFQYEKRKVAGERLKKAVAYEEKMELLARVRIGDEEGSVQYLKILLERLAQLYTNSVDMFKAETFDLIMSLCRIVHDFGGNASEILSESTRVIQDLQSTIRYDKYVQKVCEFWRKMIKQLEQGHGLEVSPVIRMAIAHIKENHHRKMSLTQIAQYCFISTHYFAHLFKKEVGLSFIEYVNKIRIEKAVYLLETTDLTVREIARQVGFPDANYFARKFKVYMNGCPTNYRTAKLY
ncbi:helix-turn-helix domain-containing protein [Paenibacillus sp. GCM10027628]|uniref:helix-turn-helix domain-containing protein n=1 Tax=Paenibacillus sp. GCM10027628 TaxID=3273413 RepID=UPI003642B5C1